MVVQNFLEQTLFLVFLVDLGLQIEQVLRQHALRKLLAIVCVVRSFRDALLRIADRTSDSSVLPRLLLVFPQVAEQPLVFLDKVVASGAM